MSFVELASVDLADAGTQIKANNDYFWSSWMQGLGYRNSVGNFRQSNYATEYGTYSEVEEGLYTIFDSTRDDILISEIYFEGAVSKFNSSIWYLTGKATTP